MGRTTPSNYIFTFEARLFESLFYCKGGEIMSITINEKEYYGIIYKIENIVNHKVYIGQTTHKRGFNGRYDYKGVGIERVYKYLLGKSKQVKYCNQHLLRSIKKYGFDAFIVDEIFDTAENEEDLNEKERYYIKQFDSFKNGYNRSLGGDSIQGATQPNGKDSPSCKRVCQISTDGKLIKIWDCILDAENELNVLSSHISNVCKNKRKLAGGFVWVYEEDYDPNKDYKRIPRIKDMGKGTKPVLLLSEDNEIIQEFYSVNDAGMNLGISGAAVCLICNHKTKRKPRFNLIFKSEYIEEQRLNVRGSYDMVS